MAFAAGSRHTPLDASPNGYAQKRFGGMVEVRAWLSKKTIFVYCDDEYQNSPWKLGYFDYQPDVTWGYKPHDRKRHIHTQIRIDEETGLPYRRFVLSDAGAVVVSGIRCK